MLTFGRILGIVAAAAHVAFWASFAFINPLPGSTRGTTLIGATMMTAGAMAALAAWKAVHLAMYLLFFVMFVPLGLYLAVTAGAFSIIGWIHVAYLASAVLVHRGILTAKL
jgi:hypothetical protein